MRAVVAGQRWWQRHRRWSGNPSVQFTLNWCNSFRVDRSVFGLVPGLLAGLQQVGQELISAARFSTVLVSKTGQPGQGGPLGVGQCYPSSVSDRLSSMSASGLSALRVRSPSTNQNISL